MIIDTLKRLLGTQALPPTITPLPPYDIPPHLVARKRRLEDLVRTEERLLEQLGRQR